MEISKDDHISGFNVTQSNKLRKGIAKKDEKLQEAMKKMFFEHGKEIGTSENLLNYIWKEVIGKQLGLNTAQVKPCERMQKRCPYFLRANGGR